MPLLLEKLEPELFPGLAREHLLLESGDVAAPILYLWRGPRAVVLGKNQNPWREGALGYIRDAGLEVARRVSGGGAVYHDPGNLNISWIVRRTSYRPEVLQGCVIRGLAAFGVEAESVGGNVRVEGKKVSGSAYCYRRDRVLHHGTLLLDADLGALRAALSTPRLRVRTHAVGSIPAQTANVGEFCPGLGMEELAGEIRKEAERTFGEFRGVPKRVLPRETVRRESERLRSPEWVWGRTPRFQGELMVGEASLTFEVAKGRFEGVRRGEELVEGASGVAFTLEGLGELAGCCGMGEEELRQAFAGGGWVLPGRLG